MFAGLENIADVLPFGGDGATDIGQGSGDLRDGCSEFGDVFARFAIDEMKTENGVAAKEVNEFLAINVGLPLSGTAVGGDDEDFCVGFAVFD